MPLSPREHDNLTRWNGSRRGFYEVYYLKWNDLKSQTAVWLRYTLLAPKNREPEFSVWGIYFDAKAPSKNFGLKKTYTRAESTIEHDIFYFQAGPSSIFDQGARGELSDGKNSMSWEIHFDQTKALSLKHYPWPLYHGPFPKTKFLAPYLTTLISGDLTVNGNKMHLENLPAHQAHLWGTEHAHSWAWGNCNAFDDPEFVFEGFSAQVDVAGKTSPPMTLLFFWWDGKLYAFNSFKEWFANKSRHKLDRWHFEAGNKNLRFVGNMTTSPEHITGVRYDDPTGSIRYCHNTKIADLKIEILQKNKAGWETVKTVTASKTAAFEVVEPDHDARVPLLIP